MICIYSTDNTNYSNNGDAVLIPISCTLTMTINGAWQFDLEHPYDAEERYKLIQEGAVIRADIKCVGEQSTICQRFRIYTYNRGVNSVTCIAFPIAMEATFDAPIDNLVLENKTASEAVAQLQALTQKYSIETNVTGTKSTSFANTNINSALASGDDGCFIQVWGGEVVYDNLKFNIRSRIGSDTGYKIQYGHNMTGIDYSKDDSGLSTRVHPISEDGIRLNGTGYVDSPLIDEYPIHHDRYMITPYRLVDTEEASPSRTAQETRACVSAVTSATTTLSQSSYATALNAGYQPDYIKTINADIITAVQNMALVNVISTDLYKLLSDTIKNAMAWIADLTQPEWGWMGSDETGWRYGDTNGYAKDMYVRIGKTWSYFGSQGYWEEPKDDKEEWDWYQKEGEGRRYGNFNKYFAHNTFVYITMEGTLQEYWFNEEGWYEADESGESEWSWHGSGTSEDPYWFGEEGATSEDPKKYAHDTWLFIDGAYYFFDSYGYYAPNTAILDYQWDWVQDDERWWFGNAVDREFAAVYVESQWLKINGTWYYFDEDGYVVDQDSSRSDAIAVFTTGMASLLTTVNTRKDALYTLLYALMTEWVNKKYAEGIDKPALTVTVSMADLSRTTEYANFVALETIKLGDSVEIDDTEHGIHTTGSRVIGLTYDVIRGYNSNVVIGKPQATVSSMLSQANGQAVAGGFDTSAIEAQIDALQDRVSDVRYNGRSLLQGTIAILDSIGGTSINYGTSTPTGGSDGDVYFQTDSNGNIIKIWQNHSGVWGGMTGGGLEYWTETSDQIKREFVLEGIDADDGYIFDDVTWTNYCPSHSYQGNFSFKKANSVPAICGAEFYIQNKRFYLMSTSLDGVKWLYQERTVHSDWKTPSESGNNTGTERMIEIASFVVDGVTWYISKGRWNWEGNDTQPIQPFIRFDTNTAMTMEQAFNRLYAQSHASPNTPCVAGIGKDDKILFHKVGEDYVSYITEEGIYEGSDYKANGTSLLDLIDAKQDKLIAGQNVQIASDGKTISATDTTYSDFEGTDGTTAGSSGLVPAPAITDVNKYLKGDGTWAEVQGGGGGGSNLILDAQRYSLDEQVVGIWTDGKPLYQKTWTGLNVTPSYNSWTNIIPNNANIETLVRWQALSNGDYKNIDGTGIEWQVLSDYIRAEYNQNANVRTIEILTLQYTKTTDTAGSGGYQAYGFSPIIYSDVEREVGVWRDNKPLYQKTINIGALNTAENTKTYNHGIADIDNIVYQNTIAINTTNGRTIVIPYTDTSVNYNQCISVDKTKVSVWGGVDRSMYNGYVTIQYTKTTDTAGSGEYNTLAIPNVHYSTDEQVIGTWMGETLYQKTCATPLTLNTGSGEKTYTLDISNVDKIISAEYSTGDPQYYINVTRTSSNDEIRVRIGDGNQLRVWSGYDRSTKIVYTTLQYTKTTD